MDLTWIYDMAFYCDCYWLWNTLFCACLLDQPQLFQSAAPRAFALKTFDWVLEQLSERVWSDDQMTNKGSILGSILNYAA